MSKYLTLMHHKGGVGKSTLTYNLAKNISNYAKTCIIDFDSQGSLINTGQFIKIPIFSYEEFIIKNKLDISKIDNKYDFIFIDTPPYISNFFHDICNISDLIIIPLKAAPYDFITVNEMLNLMTKEIKNKCFFVLNMVIKNSLILEETKKEIAKYNIYLAKTSISNLMSFVNSVMDYNLNSTAKKQIDDLTEEIINKINNNNYE